MSLFIFLFTAGIAVGQNANQPEDAQKVLNHSQCEADYEFGYETGLKHGQQWVFGYPMSSTSCEDEDEDEDWDCIRLEVFSYLAKSVSCENSDCFSEEALQMSLITMKEEKEGEVSSHSQCEMDYQSGYETGFKETHPEALDRTFNYTSCKDWDCFRIKALNGLAKIIACENHACFYEEMAQSFFPK